MAGKRRRTVTGISKTSDGRWYTWCHVCPKRGWRRLKVDERVRTTFVSRGEAIEQIARHRKSEPHLYALKCAADQRPTPEEKLLDEIFGTERKPPCSKCGERHHARIACATAERFRSEGVQRVRE